MIKYLFIDVDGTLTDGQVYIGNQGELCKGFYVRDGLGIQIAIKEGVVPVIFTSRKSNIVNIRCKELGITEIYQGIKDKKEELNRYIHDRNISFKDIAYIADDVNDIGSMSLVKKNGGLLGCPCDAVTEIVSISDFVSRYKGGNGAVREFIEWLISCENKDDSLDRRIAESVEYIKKLDKTNLQPGKYLVDENFYYIVQSYQTNPIEKCKLESHRKYVDIQWMISGEEVIETKDIACLNLDVDYLDEKDIMYWIPQSNMMRVILTAGSYVVLYPRDAHRGSISVNENVNVIKIVGKVRL